MARDIYYQLRLVYWLCHFLDKGLSLPPHAMIMSMLNNCNVLYVGAALEDVAETAIGPESCSLVVDALQ